MARSQNRFYLAGDQVDADGVEAALGNYYVGVSLGWFHELEMHWPDGHHVLFDHRLERPPSLMNVAIQPANEANIGVGIDKNLEVHQAAQSRITEDQDS